MKEKTPLQKERELFNKSLQTTILVALLYITAALAWILLSVWK